MSNKRVPELKQITTGELDAADLFLLSDISAQESKKLTLGDLSTHILTGGNLTGSFFGTSSWAQNAVSASFANVQSSSFATTASFALNAASPGIATSASWASQSLSSSFASTASFVFIANAATASFATSSRFASSASFVIFTGGNNGTISNAISAVTATSATSASFSLVATTASFARSSSISATSLSSNSASNSITSSHSLFALTASVGITTNVQTSASWASQSLSSSTADFAIEALTAITASYVLPDLSLQQEGVFLAITQSNYKSQIDKVNIVPFFSGPATTSIEAVGTIVAPYTSSILLDESVTLYVLGRESGIIYTVDSTPIYVNIQGNFAGISASVQASLQGQLTGSITGSTQGTIGGTVTSTIMGSASGSISGSLIGQFTGSISGSDAQGDITGSLTASYNAILTASMDGTMNGSYTGSLTSSISASYSGIITGSISGSVNTFLSGAMKIPFSLMGQIYLPTGSYMLFLSASTDRVFIEPTRTARFSVSSNIDQFSVTSGELLQLTTDSPTDPITFTSSAGGPFTDTAANIVITGSNEIFDIDISSVSGIRYIWTLENLTSVFSFGNTLINDIGGMPNSLITMSVAGGSLVRLYPLSQSALSILDFSNNNVAEFPTIPTTMSFINCSNNPILALPTTIPHGVTQLYANSTQITTPPTSLPSQILSMSFANNSNLNLWLTTLPFSMSYFDISSCPLLTALPTIPANVQSLNVSFDALTDVAQDNICANLVTNGLLSGSLNLLGNAPLLPITLTRIATLQSRAWTVSY
jgi:hypothetical protein